MTEQTVKTAVANSESDDALLTAFCNSGCEDAFRTIVERHAPMVSSVCISVLGDRCDAEDAFQATYFILARHAHKIVNKQTLAAWLHRVALRCALAARRRRKKRPTVPLPSEDFVGDSQLERVSSRAMLLSLHEQLNRLPDDYRVPMIIHYLHGENCAQIARQMQLNEVAVRKRLQRGRELLRRRLATAGWAGISLVIASRVAVATGTTHISVPAIESTVTVAAQVKVAWAKGLIATTGHQPPLALAQGVLKTMLLTSFAKSTFVICFGALVGLTAVSAFATTQDAEQKATTVAAAQLLADGPPQPSSEDDPQLKSQKETGAADPLTADVRDQRDVDRQGNSPPTEIQDPERLPALIADDVLPADVQDPARLPTLIADDVLASQVQDPARLPTLIADDVLASQVQDPARLPTLIADDVLASQVQDPQLLPSLVADDVLAANFVLDATARFARYESLAASTERQIAQLQEQIGELQRRLLMLRQIEQLSAENSRLKAENQRLLQVIQGK